MNMKRHTVLTGLVVVLLVAATSSGRSEWSFQTSSRVLWRSSTYTSDTTAVTAAANDLSATLGQMTGTTPAVVSGTNPVSGDVYLEVQLPPNPGAVDIRGGELERYRIEAANGSLHISGPTGTAVRNGVAAFLREKGCRWLMPSPKWWVIPTTSSVTFDGVRESQADFAYRLIWYAYGTGWFSDGATWYDKWVAFNQMENSTGFKTGHSYSNIIGRNQAAFEAHPEYYAIDENGVSHATWPQAARKFHFANDGLRALCATDRQNLLAQSRVTNPYEFMVSMDPSDGPTTDYHADSVALGTTTDRVCSLSNYVAAHLRSVYPNAWVGMYAYGAHRDPPTIALESNIHVAVAMAFNNSDFTYEQLIENWGAAAGSLGIREYYGVEEWDWGLPGIRGAKTAYLREMIPFFFENGAVSLSAETNANWGGQALGLYVASHLLWNVEEDVDALVDDFLTSAFGAGKPAMRRFYDVFEGSPRLSPPLVVEMYDDLMEALDAVEGNAACRARVVDLIAYMNYADIFRVYDQTPEGDDKWDALFDLMNYAHRIESRNVVHTYALARRLCNGAVDTEKPEFYMFGDPIWRVGAQYTDEEVLTIAGQRRQALQTAMADRVAYTRDLVMVDGGTTTSSLPRQVKFRYEHRLYLEPVASGTFAFGFDTIEPTIRIEGTLIRQRDSAEVATISLTGTSASQSFALEQGELYCLKLATGGASAVYTVPDGVAAAMEASERDSCYLDYCGGFVYVPPGTAEIRAYTGGRLSLVSPSGVRTDLNSTNAGPGGYNTLAVPTGQDRAVWTVYNQTRGDVGFLNVPPVINLNRAHLLLPREALPLVRTAGDVPTETLPAVSKVRGNVQVLMISGTTTGFSFTFTPPTGKTVSGTLVRESDNQQIGSFSTQTPNTIFTGTLEAGKTYRFEITAPTNLGTSITVPAGLAAAFKADAAANLWLDYSGGYLHVPRERSEIVCTGNPRLSLTNPAGVRTDVTPASYGPDGLARVPVASGHDDRIWIVHAQTRGTISLRNVPPYVNLNRAWMLMPGSPFAN